MNCKYCTRPMRNKPWTGEYTCKCGAKVKVFHGDRMGGSSDTLEWETGTMADEARGDKRRRVRKLKGDGA